MKKKVFISVLKIVDQGGISASIQNLLNEIHDQYDVTLCSIEDYISPNANIPDNVKIIKGSSLIGDAVSNRSLISNQPFQRKTIRTLVRIVRRLGGLSIIIKYGLKQIKMPHQEYAVAIAFTGDRYRNGRLREGGEHLLISRYINAKRRVAWVHNDIRELGYNHDICLRTFQSFDAIVSVSYDNKKLLDKMVPEYVDKSFVVYNTYNLKRILELGNNGRNPYESSSKLHFVTVARLAIAQKRQDRIIKVCSRLKKEGLVNFEWYLVGGGEQDVLEQMVKDYDVQDIVYFTGQLTNPYPYMKYADAFVLTSLYEGYGMTNKEAQVLGTPTLVTNYSAACEAVKNGKEGFICDNSTEGVYQMIKNILQHPEELNHYRQYLLKHPINNDNAIEQFRSVCGLI